MKLLSKKKKSRWAEVARTLPQGETGLMWCYCPLSQSLEPVLRAPDDPKRKEVSRNFTFL